MLTTVASRPSPVWASQQAKMSCWPGVRGGKYHLVDTLPKWKELHAQMIEQVFVACDLECNSLSYLTGKIVGFSFSWGAENSFYVPIRHTQLVQDPSVAPEDWNPKKPKWVDAPSDEKQLKLEQIWDDLQQFYSDPDITTIWHNGKFDIHFLRMEGFTLMGIMHDTRLMHSLLDENSSAALKDIANILIDRNANQWEKMVDDWRAKYARAHKMPKKDVHYGLIPLEIMTPYASSDAHYTLLVYKDHLPQIANNESLRNLYVQVEAKLLWTLLDMEHDGVVINRDYLGEAGPEMQTEMERLGALVKEKLGSETVNINSNIQVIPILQKLGVRLWKKTKTGRPSLDAEVLESLGAKYDVCRDLMNYRKLDKKLGTYVNSILEKTTADQKLHCEYNQNVTTGRMSAKKPNTMNIPRGDVAIRRAFVAPERFECMHCSFVDDYAHSPTACPSCGSSQFTVDNGYFLCFIDLSQIEVRLTAHFSEDPILLDVYCNTGEDVHLRTCCEMFSLNYSECEKILADKKHKGRDGIKKKRQIAKMINFLIIYGGGAKNLAAKISTPEEPYTEADCKVFIKRYFEKYKGVQKWINRTKLLCREQLGLQNHFGRWRRLPELKDANRRIMIKSEKWKIERAQRQGVNFMIQGTAADLFKIALVRVHDMLKGKKTRMVMPIHDEIVFYYHRSEMAMLPDIKHEMEDFHFRVPIIAEVAYSQTNWADKKELSIAA